jgi:hypothetical protein
MNTLTAPPEPNAAPSSEKITFSEYVDLTVKRTVKQAITESKFGAEFHSALSCIADKTNRHEQVIVSFWYAPFVYIEVKDTRWKHYPCGMRFLVSFDLSNGLLASESSENQYAFARKGWASFAENLIGKPVEHYGDCGDPSYTDHCSTSHAGH